MEELHVMCFPTFSFLHLNLCYFYYSLSLFNINFYIVNYYLTDRPFPRHPRPESNWLQLDAEVEVRMAISQGLDGFIYECKQDQAKDVRWNRLPSMNNDTEGER